MQCDRCGFSEGPDTPLYTIGGKRVCLKCIDRDHLPAPEAGVMAQSRAAVRRAVESYFVGRQDGYRRGLVTGTLAGAAGCILAALLILEVM